MATRDQQYNAPKPEGFINSMIEQASNIGYQRSNRYIVILHGPKVEAETNGPAAFFNPITNSLMNVFKKSNFDLQNPLRFEEKKRLALNCSSVTLPGKSLLTNEFSAIGSGPVTKFPYAENFTGSITLDFNCGVDFFERKYFMGWQQTIIDSTTHDVEIYENYAKKWKILVVMLPADMSNFINLSSAFAGDDQNIRVLTEGKTDDDPGQLRDLYYVRMHEVYPVEIVETPLSYDPNNQVMNISVKFNYKYWDDPITVYSDSITRLKELGLDNDRVGLKTIPESPFMKFTRILRDVARYSDINELKQLVIDQSLGTLNDIFGVENVEAVAQAGQIIDVFRRIPNKDYVNTVNRLLGPLGKVI